MSSCVLHIAADFPNQDIYPRLVNALSAHVPRQLVLAAVRTAAEAARIQARIPGVHYELRHMLSPAHRFLFRTKIRKITRHATKMEGMGAVTLIHAHSLYSDGAAALRLSRQYRVPFVAAVRNVDVNAFMRLRPDLFMVRNAVLQHASNVIFLSPAYRDAFLGRLGGSLADTTSAKAMVVPNGVAPLWLEKFEPAQAPFGGKRTLRLLYVGDFSSNKNLRGILACIPLVARVHKVSMTIVGGVRADLRQSDVPAGGVPDCVDFAGRITDAARLREIYRQHDIFVMPSFAETFGVAYIEALSQGLPIVHSRGQGVDGYFDECGVAERVNPGEPSDIALAIGALAARLPEACGKCRLEARRFDWPGIGAQYAHIYEEVERCHCSNRVSR